MSIDKFGRSRKRKSSETINDSFRFTLGGNLNINNKRLLNVAEPEQEGDGVNKAYIDRAREELHNETVTLLTKWTNVDSHIKQAITGETTPLKKELDGIKSRIKQNADAVSDLATKCLTLNKAGSYDAKKRKIINVPAPEASADAVNHLHLMNQITHVQKSVDGLHDNRQKLLNQLNAHVVSTNRAIDTVSKVSRLLRELETKFSTFQKSFTTNNKNTEERIDQLEKNVAATKTSSADHGTGGDGAAQTR